MNDPRPRASAEWGAVPRQNGLTPSNERFAAIYRIAGDEAQARERAAAITIEQTVEFPPDLVADADIREGVFGRLEDLEPAPALGGQPTFRATISYANEIAGVELTQLLNVLFGNTSLKPGIRLERFLPSEGVLAAFSGPRFGVAGLRARVGGERRPLLCTAIKPLGLSPASLAAIAGAFARGGIDLIKDDHGLADQPFCRFADRVLACSEAVRAANSRTGHACLYVPNVTASPQDALERAHLAKELGAGGLLVAPGLAGWDTLRILAADPELGLPVLCHPALLGAFHGDPGHGIGHEVVYGVLPRLAGADATIFPSFGGRFSFTEDDCRDLVRGATGPLGSLAPVLPAPAGGMTLDRVSELIRFYGPDIALLIGGDLHRHGPDLAANAARFVASVEEAAAASSPSSSIGFRA